MDNGLHCLSLRRGLLRIGGVWLGWNGALRVVHWGFFSYCIVRTRYPCCGCGFITAYRTTFNGIMRVYMPCLLSMVSGATEPSLGSRAGGKTGRAPTGREPGLSRAGRIGTGASRSDWRGTCRYPEQTLHKGRAHRLAYTYDRGIPSSIHSNKTLLPS